MNDSNRVAAGFFSLSAGSPSGDDRPYLAWHLLDHLPEQYRIPGILLGQRWASTPDCRGARAVGGDGWSDVDHVVCYLMTEPVDSVLDEFVALGNSLHEAGRFEVQLPSRYRGPLRLTGTRAAGWVAVSPDVVPFRPHRGIYLIVEALGPQRRSGTVTEPEVLDSLVTVPGVAGAWVFTTTGEHQRTLFSRGPVQITVCYLDDEPVMAATRLEPLVTDLMRTRHVLLAAPFESLVRWDWERFGSASPGPLPDGSRG
ncbi:MAG: hypothetical protein ACYDDZ_00735 [Acidimicrobiales bacterium]